MLELRAEMTDDGAAAITFPSGLTVRSDDARIDQELSAFLGRHVHLTTEAPAETFVERADPVVAGEFIPEEGRRVTIGRLGDGAPAGSFFDYAPLHVITTATLARLQELAPESRFHPDRFRPNLLLDLPDVEPFTENGWTGARLHVGDTVVLALDLPSPRCAIPMLAQADLPHDPNIIRAVARHNRILVPDYGAGACVGAYAQIVRSGTIHVGDPLRLECREINR
jgi:uncharacterized protein YcbX